jgi:hypothetical protein
LRQLFELCDWRGFAEHERAIGRQISSAGLSEAFSGMGQNLSKGSDIRRINRAHIASNQKDSLDI